MMKKKILLTGGNGFIGKNIQESFLAQTYDILAPRSYELNLIDVESVDAFFKDKYFDCILHAGVKPGHRNAKDPTNLFYSNLRMFMNLERHKDKFSKFINFGSGAIYDTSKNNEKVREEDIFQNMGKDDHSFCKYVEHKLIDNLDNFIDLNIFGIFGKYEDWQIRFISNAICKAIYGLPITLRQNRRFSYLYVKDLFHILEYIIENDMKYNSYNIVPDETVDLLDLANMVKDISPNNVEIKVNQSGYGLEYTGDNHRIKQEYKDVSFTNFKVAIKELYSYYDKVQDSIDKNLLLVDK